MWNRSDEENILFPKNAAFPFMRFSEKNGPHRIRRVSHILSSCDSVLIQTNDPFPVLYVRCDLNDEDAVVSEC
jgi:hypothetical protein